LNKKQASVGIASGAQGWLFHGLIFDVSEYFLFFDYS